MGVHILGYPPEMAGASIYILKYYITQSRKITAS